MLIILKENIKTLGILGDVVQVKDGYARNFLFPQKKAIKATKENIAKLERHFSSLKEESIKKFNLAKKLESCISGKSLILVKKVSNDGKIFGSITTRELAKSPLFLKYKIDYRKISFNGIKIKKLGEYKINVKLHKDVVPQIIVHVVKSENDANELKKKIGLL